MERQACDGRSEFAVGERSVNSPFGLKPDVLDTEQKAHAALQPNVATMAAIFAALARQPFTLNPGDIPGLKHIGTVANLAKVGGRCAVELDEATGHLKFKQRKGRIPGDLVDDDDDDESSLLIIMADDLMESNDPTDMHIRFLVFGDASSAIHDLRRTELLHRHMAIRIEPIIGELLKLKASKYKGEIRIIYIGKGEGLERAGSDAQDAASGELASLSSAVLTSQQELECVEVYRFEGLV